MNTKDLLLHLSQIQVRSSADDAFILEVDEFSVKRGERVGIFGDSGSGKTTLLKVLSGSVFFDESYKVFGKCVFSPKKADPVELHELKSIYLRQQKYIPIAFVPQEPMAAFSLVHKIGKQLDDIAVALPAGEAFKLVGLDKEFKNRYPRQLSLGQMQRVAIAAALCMGAELILMDEPTASLDILQKQNLLEILNQLNEIHGVSFVVVSHQSDFIQAFCSATYKMENGFLLKEAEFPSKHYLMYSNQEKSGDIVESKNLSVVDIKNLNFRYPGQGQDVLNNFNFEFQKGRSYGITGASGCGKSTLGRLICGLDYPDSGCIHYEGKEAQDHTIAEWTHRKRSIQYLWQDALMAMNPAYTARRILQFAFNDARLWQKDLTEEHMLHMIEYCKIEDSMLDLYPVQLSGGQRQRINLAKSLLGKPQLIIADEPFSAIDESGKPALYELFNSITQKEKVTLILISHDPADLIACCENILIMDSGSVVESGNLEKIIKNPAQAVTRQLLSASYVNRSAI